MRQRYNKTQRFYALAPVGITVFLQLWLVDIQSKLLLTLPTIEGRSVVSKAVQVINPHTCKDYSHRPYLLLFYILIDGGISEFRFLIYEDLARL